MAGQILIWGGAALAALGMALIIWCAVTVRAARGQGDAALRARMARILPWNMAALAIATFGLLGVILGIVLR